MSDRFAFVVPLRNPNLAKNWDATVKLCVDTLRSLASSDSSLCEVILVCRDFPSLDFPSNVTILRHPFLDPRKTWEDQHIDKYLKIKLGLVELRRRGSSYYVMKFDADDLVSRKLVPWILSDGNRHGYIIQKGYKLDCSTKQITKIESQFHRGCGSSNILYAPPESLPTSMEDRNPYDLMTQGHNIVEDTFINRGAPLRVVPFPAIIYRTQTGENITSSYTPPQIGGPNYPNWKFHVGKYVRDISRICGGLFYRGIDKKLVDEFKIP